MAIIIQAEQQQLRRYLLGQLAETEEEQVELRLLTEADYAAELGILENELIDHYVTDKLTIEEHNRFEQHFLKATERREKLAFATALNKAVHKHAQRLQPAAKKIQPSWYFSLPVYVKAAAAIVIVLGMGLGGWRLLTRRPDEEEGLAALRAAYKSQRLIEARATNLDYAKFHILRGQEKPNVDEDLLKQAEYQLGRDLKAHHDAKAYHAMGLFYLAGGQLDQAVANLDMALKQAPDDAQINSDLGAALLEQGQQAAQNKEFGKAFEYLAQSLEPINRALQLKPNLLEALFNKALCLQAMKSPEQAKDAWRNYLAHDSQSQWADEARHKLQELSARNNAPVTAAQVLEDFLAAFHAHNDEQAWQVMSQNREPITGKMIPPQLERRYISAVLSGQEASAQEILRAFFYAGELELHRGGDPYTSELAHYYGAASITQRQSLAEALENIDQGYQLCLDDHYRDARQRFEQGLALFNQALDPWEASLAEYWISYCYTQTDQIKDSIALLQAVAEFCQSRNYKWLLAQTDNWLATTHASLNEYSAAINYDQQALAIASAIADTYQMQKILSQLGTEYAYLRQRQLSLEYHYRCLNLAWQFTGSPRQAWRNFSSTLPALFAFKYYEAAAVCANEAQRIQINDPSLTYVLYLRLGMIYSRLERFKDAIDLANFGFQTALAVPDVATRRKYVAAAYVARGNIWFEAHNYNAAIGQYNQAIANYELMEFKYYSYAAYKGRLLCALALNDQIGIQHDLSILLRLVERYRAEIHEEQYRNSFFDNEQSVYDLAVEYEYQEHDYFSAFNYAEASHARSLLDALAEGAHIETTAVGPDVVSAQVTQPVALESLQQRIPAQVRVVMYTVLPDKLLIWQIGREQFAVQEVKLTADALAADVRAYVDSLRDDSAESRQISQQLGTKLYGILLEHSTVGGEQTLCIIPDKFLNYLPFAALISPQSGRYLIEDQRIFYAPSLNVMLNCSHRAQTKAQQDEGTILSIGNPAFDRAKYPNLLTLEDAEREASVIATLFSRPTPLLWHEANKENILRAMPTAEIIHFAGHYVMDDSNPLLSKMLLAAPATLDTDGQNSTLSAAEILSQKFDRTKLIVLSACQTGLDKYYNGEGAVGLARAFIEAKIPLVVASQWAIDSDATADLMIDFYRNRRTGSSTIDALRQAQLAMLHGADATYQSPHYWAAFLCVGGYATY